MAKWNRVSEWLWVSNFSVVSWRDQVNFQWDNGEIRFVLDQHAELDCYSASSLKQQSVDRHVAPLGHIILIPSQPVFALLLLNAACLAEMQQLAFISWVLFSKVTFLVLKLKHILVLLL
jgi:hypothetical protein